MLVDVRSDPPRATSRFLNLPATPFYDVLIAHPAHDLTQLSQRYPYLQTALARCHVRYNPAEDDLYAILAKLSQLVPRCYERTWTAVRTTSHTLRETPASTTRQPTERHSAPALRRCHKNSRRNRRGKLVETCATVLDYLTNALQNDVQRDAILALARQLWEETT